MNCEPIRLRSDDLPAPAPPEEAGYALADMARRLAEESDHLAKLIRSWAENPIDVQRLAQTRSHELAQMASRLPKLCESAMQSKRAAGHFSAPYSSDDLGVRS